MGELVSGGEAYCWTLDAAEGAEKPRVDDGPEDDAEGRVEGERGAQRPEVAMWSPVLREELDGQERLDGTRQRQAGEAKELRSSPHDVRSVV